MKEVHPTDLLIASSGGIHTGIEANKLLESNCMDILLVGRIYLKNSGIVWQLADELGIQLEQPQQKAWIFNSEGQIKK